MISIWSLISLISCAGHFFFIPFRTAKDNISVNRISSFMNQNTCGCHCWFGNMLVFCVAQWLCCCERMSETGVLCLERPWKGHAVLFLWAGGETWPLCCSDKTFIFQYFLKLNHSDFICFPWDLFWTITRTPT